MNHDYGHCMDWNRKDCPQTCFRAELTAELERPEVKARLTGVPLTWARFAGSPECEKGRAMQNEYTLVLTGDEFDVLEAAIRRQYRDDGIELICRPHETKTALRKRTQIQGRIIGKIMDARRRAGEIRPRRDPANPLLPAGEDPSLRSGLLGSEEERKQ